MDVEDQPVPGATVRLDGVPIGSSTDGGRLVVEGLPEGPVSLEVLSRNHREVTALQIDVSADTPPRAVTLEQARGSVRVRALGPGGPVDGVSIRFDGPTRIPATPLGSDGERIFPGLDPGAWEVWAISPAWGLQRRDILIDHDEDAIMDVVFQLQPPEGGAADLRVLVVDPDGQPLPNVSIAIDGRDYGLTANGGAVDLSLIHI